MFPEKYVVGTTGGNLVSIQEEEVPANVVIHQHSPYYGYVPFGHLFLLCY